MGEPCGMKIFLIFENQFGGVDSVWSSAAKAKAAADAANEYSKSALNGRHFYIVREFEVDNPNGDK